MRKNLDISIIKLILSIILAFSFFGTLEAQQGGQSSKIYILPGAKYLTNFGNEIDNIKLAGNARFMHDNVYMDCDTAYIYNKSQSVRAVGHIKINRRNKLFLYGDTLKYYGETKMAYVYGNVRLVEEGLTLTTDAIAFNLKTNVATYSTGGKVVSKKNNNTLESKKGFYFSDEKKLTFKENVSLVNDDYIMKSNELDYFEDTEKAYFRGNTTIEGDSNFIFCKSGWYDTKNDLAEFNKDAYLIASNNRKLEGDKLFYDGKNKYTKAIKNVTITDSSNKMIINGGFAEYFEILSTALITDAPKVKKWFEDGDTLHLLADTLRVKRDTVNKDSRVYAYKNVQFFKQDVQGSCDSMIFREKDSMIHLFYDPVVWSDNSQLTGDTINIKLGKKSLDYIDLEKNAFVIEQVKQITFKDSTQTMADTTLTDYYNQIKGKFIKGVFKEDSIRKVYVDGNGQSVYYTNEPGKPIQALNKIICSDIVLTFANNQVVDILFMKKPEGTLYPLKDISEKDRKLDGFKWIANRPKKSNFE